MDNNNTNTIQALGVIANVLKKDNAVLEQNVVFTLGKDDKATVELTVGVFDDSTNSGTINLIVQTVERGGNTMIRYGTNPDTGDCVIQLCDFFNGNDTKSDIVVSRKIAEYMNRSIIVETILSYASNKSNTLIANLNIYSQTY